MPIDIVLDGTSTLDESAGLQTGADGTNSTDDTDISYASLPTDFTDRLTTLGTSSTYPTSVGASSAVDLINVTSDGPISSLGFTDSTGGDFDGTQWSGLYTDRYDDEDPTAREKIYLVSDSNGQIVLGVTDPGQADETIVFAVYLDPDGTTSPIDATVWSVTFEPIFHPDTNSQDDAVDLLDQVYVTATGTKTFNFDALPSGQNLFGIVGDVNDAIVVTGELPVLKADGTYTNTSDTINTSKGGGPTTIGIDNQSFDPIGGGTAVNDGAFFTYVEDPDPRYLAGVTGGLNQNEADDADNVLFGNTKEVNGAFLKIVQVVGNGDASLNLTAYDLSDNTRDGRTFVQNQGSLGGSTVDITHVWIYNGSIDDANLVEDSDLDLSSAVGITITNGVASISGLQDGYVVVWETAGLHDQVRVQANSGSSAFDIGLFGLLDGQETTLSLADHVFVEDDGPAIDPDIEDGAVKYETGVNGTDTHTLNGSDGTDATAVYAITNFTSSFSLLDVDVIGTINTDKTVVQYFEDRDGSTDYSAGDVLYYTMSLTPAGSYTFTVENAPAAPPLEFDFNGLPSGQNLFGMVADAGAPNGPGCLFFGENALINDPGNGQFTNGSDTINTSKGGGPTTIGVNNQMIDPGEGVYFTIVNDPDDRYLANVTGGLNQNEADDADNMLFASLREVDSAFFGVSQTQGNEVEACTVEAFDITSSGGRGIIAASGQNHVDIVSVSVYLGSVDPLNLLETTDGSGADGLMSSSIEVSIDADGIAHISGLEAGYVVAWSTGANDHDQVLIEGTAGKFDIGSFGLNEAQAIPDHTLDFTVSLTDADGDSVSDSFQVSVDAVPYV